MDCVVLMQRKRVDCGVRNAKKRGKDRGVRNGALHGRGLRFTFLLQQKDKHSQFQLTFRIRAGLVMVKYYG